MRNSRNRSRRITNNPDAGFSLIEVVLAIGILMVVSLPLLNYFTESIRYSSMMERRQRATFLAQKVTEGLLAENGLISGTEGSYSVKYLEDLVADPTDLVKTSGVNGELIYSMAKDGYRVEVTIDNPGAAANVRNFLDYRINSLANVVYMDTTENTQAVFELLGMHYSYNSFYPGDENWSDTVDESWIREHMSRNMQIDVNPEGEKYRVSIKYVYKCDGIIDVNGDFLDKWESAVLMDRTVADLQNIYLIYNWCNNDTITITYPADAMEPISLGLYVICQPDEDGNKPPADYKVVVDRSGFYGDLYGYTNLNESQLVCSDEGFDTPDTTVSSGDAGPAVTYTIHTKVYLAEDTAGENPLADITTKKGD